MNLFESLGHGGGIIKYKWIFSVLVLFSLALLINVSDVSAANSTFNSTSVSQSAATVQNYVEINHTIPQNVTVANQKVSSAQYLYLVTSTVQNINNGNTSPVTLKNVSNPTSPSETTTSGTLTKAEYISIANKITTFINTNGRLPNYVTTSLGTMRYENLIYTYSKIMTFYQTNNRLPTTVSIKPWTTLSATSEGASSSNVQSILDAIGKAEAKFADIQGQSSPTVMAQVGYGDCWADSGWLYNQLSAAGIAVRVMGCSDTGGLYYLHRWAEINIGNGWQVWNYAKYGSQHYGKLGSGPFVVKSYTP